MVKIDILVAHSFIIKYILDVVLDVCTMYKLLLEHLLPAQFKFI